MAADGWTCKFCTYPENEMEYLSCIMCNMPRNATEQEKCPICFTEAEIPEDKVGGFKCPICDHVFPAKFPHKALKPAKKAAARAEPRDEKKAREPAMAVAVSASTPSVGTCMICFSEITLADNNRCSACGEPLRPAPAAEVVVAPRRQEVVPAAVVVEIPPPAYPERRAEPNRERAMSSMPGSARSCLACFSEVTQNQGWVCSVCGYDNADPEEEEKTPVEELIIEHSMERKNNSDSDEEQEEKKHGSVDAKQDAVVSPKCPVCFTTNNVLFSQQSNIQCIICDNFWTGTEEPPAAHSGAHPHPQVAAKTITKVKGQAAINRYEAISALHNTFVYDCPMCLAVLQVPRAEKDHFKCAVCGHLCSIKFREQKKKYIHARAANAKKASNYKTMKKRGGDLEWRKRANRINEVEALLYSPFAREMNLHRDVPKKCDCVDHDEYHAPLAPETIKKLRKPTSAGEGGRRLTATEKKKRNSEAEDDEKGSRKNSNEHLLLEAGRPFEGPGRSSVAGEAKEKKSKKKKKKEEVIPKEERLFSVCLTCQERHCEKCENVIHSHLERANHVRISFDLFQRCKALFLRMEEIGDMHDTKITCSRLEHVCTGFFPKATSRTIVNVLRQNVENFGAKYEMDFRTFLHELAPRLPLQGQQVDQQESYLQRMDTDRLLNINAQEFKKQKCWSRLTQKPKVWLEQVLPGYFELWGSSIRKVEATHGAHIASYFYFSRWLFLVNLVVAFMYAGFVIFPWVSMGQATMTAPYNWWGVVVGYGLEGSVMFYGDYRYLKNPYQGIYDPSNATVMLGGRDFAQDRATFTSWGLQTLCRVNSSLLNDPGPGCGSALGCYYQVETAVDTLATCQDYCRASWCTGVQFTPPRCELWRVPVAAVLASNSTAECFLKEYQNVGVTSLYPEDTAWIILYALMLLVTVLGIIQHLGRGHSSNLKEDPQFAFSNVVFTGIDFNVSHRGAMGLLRLNLVTTLDELLKYKAEEKLKHEKKARQDVDEEADRNAWRVFSGVMVCLALATVNWVGFYFMFEWEYRTLLVGVTSAKRPFFLMVCPLIVSGTKALLPKVFNQIISMEGHVRSGPIFRHYFARVFVLALSYIAFFLLIGVYRDEGTLLSPNQCLETENGILFYRIIVAEIIVETVVVLIYPALRMQLRRLSAKLMTYRAVQGGVDKMRRTMTRRSMRKLKRNEGGQLDQAEVAEVGENEIELELNLQEQRLQHQASRAVLDQAHLEDPTKTVFNLTDNMVAIVYLQTLIFCGLLYCPALPIVGIVFHTLLFYTKRQQVAWFTKRSKRPMSVARQNRFFRIALVVSLLTTILPFTTFLRSQPRCGPHGQAGSSSVAEAFTETVNAWPNAVVVVVGYLANQMLLWMLLICLIIWAAALINRSKSISKEIASTAMRLKMETYERKKIIKEYNVSLGYDEVRGRDMIAAFIAQLGPLGTKYVAPLKEYGFGDLVRLCKLNRDQLSGLLVRVHATQDEIEVILAAVDEKRLELM